MKLNYAAVSSRQDQKKNDGKGRSGYDKRHSFSDLRVHGITPDYFPLFLSIALLMIVCIAILFFTVKEKKILQEMAPEAEADTAETGFSDLRVRSVGKQTEDWEQEQR